MLFRSNNIDYTPYVENDLHILSRFGVISDDTLKDVANRLNVDFIPAYVPIERTNIAKSDSLKMSMVGDWVCKEDKFTMNLHVDSLTNLYTHTLQDQDGNESEKNFFECRIVEEDGTLYWDEYYPEHNANTYSKVIYGADNDSFVLEIIDNGNSSDRGKKYIYTRVRENNIDNILLMR